MKTLTLLLIMIATQFCTAQNTAIPKCLAEKIEESQKENPKQKFKEFSYKALYKIEIKGEILYNLVVDYGKIKFVRMPTINYVDENCKTVFSSDDKDWHQYRNSITKLGTLWVRDAPKPSYPMATFLNTKRTFKVNAFHTDLPQFPLKEKQTISISFKDGLQILENGKLKQSYKIIPKEKIQYNPANRESKPANGGICNAILFEHDQKYWLLYAEEGKDFLLISSDKTGQFGLDASRASLSLAEEKSK